jgi:hypothetical protein
MLRRPAIFACIAVFGGALLTLTSTPLMQAKAQAVRIFVNGSEMHFDQPPIERSNRVFVPLRGIFENLGATVVYDNGVINATRGSTSVHLVIGSHNAIVNGNPVTVDVAPFVIAGRTLVPLRFIAQSLGAGVDYNYSTHVVTISGGGGGNVSAGVQLTNLSPGNGAAVASNRPSVSGSFSAAVDPNSVHITLDGRDVSSTSYVSSHNFLFSPSYDLSATSHTVRVTGRSQSGASFDQSWTFISGTNVVPNYITNISPANGATVGTTFTLKGTTLPNSSVHVAAVASAVFGMFRIGTGTYSADLMADGAGHFSQDVTVNTVGGGVVSVRITSTAPVTKASKQVDLTYHT